MNNSKNEEFDEVNTSEKINTDKKKYTSKDSVKSGRLKTRKLKILVAAALIFIFTGIFILIYPYITNYFSGRQQAGILEEWEKEATPAAAEETVNIENVDKYSENTSNKTDETIKEAEEGPADEYSNIIIDPSEELDYRTITAEDFFPLRISIPKIELDWIVNEGTDTQTLKKGPGHIIETVLPGDDGRCVISGHRTTYGAPFNKIDLLEPGDLIYLETSKGSVFTYAVMELIVVNPTDVYIIEGDSKKELILTACEPKYSAAKRLVVISELIHIYKI